MLMQGRNVLSSVNMEVAKLLSIVRGNLEKHKKEHEEAVNNWKILVVDAADENVRIARKNARRIAENVETTDLIPFKGNPVKPTSYAESYEKAIKMLELSSDTIIEIDSDVFNQLVLDEWDWQRQFKSISTMYATAAGSR